MSGAQTPDDPLILHKLTIEDMDRASGSGRYGDSTEDYAWNEMSTGALDWAFAGLITNAKADITLLVHTSSSIEEAQQRVHQYLVDHGLTNVAQVYNAATWGDDGAIVVTGHPEAPPPPIMYDFDLMGGQVAANTGGGQAASQADYSPVPDNNPDGPDVAIEVLDEANRTGVTHARDLLMAKIEVLDGKFAALSNTQTFIMKDGHSVTGAELKTWWDSLDFRITDRIFATGAGGVRDGVSNINFTAIEGYARWDANGIVFMLLHELTHDSFGGELTTATMYMLHELFGGTESNYNGSSYWFDANEEYANWGAREIMIGLGYPAPTTPPRFGYNDSNPAPPPPPYFPPDDGSGGGWGGGGNVGEQ